MKTFTARTTLPSLFLWRTVVAVGSATLVQTYAVKGVAQDLAPKAQDKAQDSVGAPLPSPDVKKNVVPVIPDLFGVVSGGLTANEVGKLAGLYSYSAKASESELKAAAARVDEAWVGFLPKLTISAKYTRLSPLTPPVFGGPLGINSVYTTDAPGTQNPNTYSGEAPRFTFPTILNNYSLGAEITIPISDYFLRIAESYSAASNAKEAAQFDVLAARAKAVSEGKNAFYNWLRSRGAVVVAEQALLEQRAHLGDAKVQYQVGSASKVDVLRAETAVASAELQVTKAQHMAQLLETQVRIAIHAPEGQNLKPGEDIDAARGASLFGDLKALVAEASKSRPEIKSIEASSLALRNQENAAGNGKFPQISAFGQLDYSNPNARLVPTQERFFATWAIGAQATWTPNDMFSAGASSREYRAKVASLESQKAALRDGIELEVVDAYQAVHEAEVALSATARQLDSATEAYRVARQLFQNGRITSTLLTDAETELTSARLAYLNARVDARTAVVKLEHALGRDAK